MEAQNWTTKIYKRWVQPQSWSTRLYKCAAFVKGQFNYLPVQTLPRVDIQLPPSAHRHFWKGTHGDLHLLQFLVQSIPPGGVFLDIGANIGVYSTTLWIAMDGNVKIYAFEPVPSTITILRETLNLNNVEALIEPIALSSEDGELILSAHSDGANNYWVKNSDSSINCPSMSVATMRLDDWCESHPDQIPNAVKIDVEGHELEVLKGAKRTLQVYKPALLVECHCASWDDLGVSRVQFIDFINSLGYTQLSNSYGQPIDFLTQASTIHLFGVA